MSTWLIAVVTLIYFGVAVSFWREGNLGNAWVFAGYALANGGFLYSAFHQ